MLVPIPIFLCEHSEFHKDRIDLKSQLKSRAGNLGRNSSNIISEYDNPSTFSHRPPAQYSFYSTKIKNLYLTDMKIQLPDEKISKLSQMGKNVPLS